MSLRKQTSIVLITSLGGTLLCLSILGIVLGIFGAHSLKIGMSNGFARVEQAEGRENGECPAAHDLPRILLH